MPGTLVLIVSADREPWRSIERNGQRPIMETILSERADLIWIRGQHSLSSDEEVQFLEEMYTAILEKKDSPRYIRRKILRILWGLYPSHNSLDRRLRLLFRKYRAHGAQIHGRVATLPIPDPITLAGLRTVETLRFALENFDFDFLLRITSSCLVNPRGLDNFLNTLAPHRLAAGQVRRFGMTKFLSGAAWLLSRDLVEVIVQNEEKYRLDVWEDVGMGALIGSLGGALFQDLPRVDIASVKDVPELGNPIWTDAVVFRCKSDSSGTHAEAVVEVMQAVASRIRL
jgi:hypothetical protein